MDWFPLYNSIRIACISTGIIFFLGIFAAHTIARAPRWLKGVLDEAAEKNAPIFVMSHHPADYLAERSSNELTDILNDYDTFYVEADMYFKAFPSGSSGSDTAENYPMSFVTWLTQSENSSSTAYRSIRVTDKGYLSTTNNPAEHPELVSNVQLPLGEWFKIRFAISPKSGLSEIFINGASVLTYSIGAVTSLASSKIRFFDSRYSYSVYLRNVSVCSDNDYRIGLIKEDSADYLAYQTTVPEKKVIDGVEKEVFNLRMIAGLDSLDYSNAGYQITVIYTKGDEQFESMQTLSTDTVFESVKSGNVWIPASELGVKYLVAIAIGDIYTDCDRIEFVIKPFTTQDGIKKYGEAAILIWGGGTDKEGYPVLEYLSEYVEYTLDVTTDTNIKLNKSDNYNTATKLELKNNGTSSSVSTTRYAFFRFDFSNLTDSARNKLLTGEQIFFEFFAAGHRTLTEEEKQEGGILCDVYLVNDTWNESKLSGTTLSSQIYSRRKIGQMRYKSGTYSGIDITKYVVQSLRSDNRLSLEIRNVNDDGAGSQTTIYALENGENVPRLSIRPIKYGHNINLGKLKNSGYEPWGYAEKLVDDWINGGREALYSVGPYETVSLSASNMTSPNGAYTVPFNKYTSSPSYDTAKYPQVIYARKLSTLKGFANSTLSAYDIYGGITNSGISGEATGYFHTEEHGGRTYIIDPIGNPFISVGINTAQLGSNQNQKNAAVEKYGSEEAFYKDVTAEMKSIGINTYWGGDDGFFENGMVRVVGLSCMSGYMGNGGSGLGLSISTGGSAKYLHNNTMNVFDPDFATFCINKIKPIVEKYTVGEFKDINDRVLGFYSDNEIPSQSDMLLCYLTINPEEPVNAFSYATAWTFMVKRTGKPNPDISDITPELSEEFKALVYDTYFKCVSDGLKNAGADNYMYLGNRIHSENMKSEGYLRAAGKYLDIISANLYGGVEPSIETIKTMYKYSGKPMLVTEFFSKANDAVDANGYPLGNQSNAGLIVDTQSDRATMYENYTLLLLEAKSCVGWTWYRFRDNDQSIYKDAEGNLYRVFDIKNNPGEITAYYNITTGEKVLAAEMPTVEQIYKGETDTSNLGSNKGIYSNGMNLYTELAGAISNISSNMFGIINYFDK